MSNSACLSPPSASHAPARVRKRLLIDYYWGTRGETETERCRWRASLASVGQSSVCMPFYLQVQRSGETCICVERQRSPTSPDLPKGPTNHRPTKRTEARPNQKGRGSTNQKGRGSVRLGCPRRPAVALRGGYAAVRGCSLRSFGVPLTNLIETCHRRGDARGVGQEGCSRRGTAGGVQQEGWCR